MNISEIITELNKLIKEKYNDFRGSYLYGSRARGDFEENSDLDIVALFDQVDRYKELEVSGISCDLDYKFGVFIEIHLYTPDELKINPVFYNEVVNKGIYYESA